MSLRTRLQTALFLLSVLAIAVTSWQTSRGATAALRKATYDHLTAVRETKRRLVEDYLADLSGHVLALSSDEAGITALEQFRAAWRSLPSVDPGDPRFDHLEAYYRDAFVPRVTNQLPSRDAASAWFPDEGRTRGLQQIFLAANPHPVGAKDLLLEAEAAGPYGVVHARYHPTLHRYQAVFGFYDVFLIDAQDGRILYSVFKEVDLGRRLTSAPYRDTALARAFGRAMAVEEPDRAVIEDYAPYPASYFAPAAFVAAPIWRAGSKIGVLAIQVSIERVNRVMTSDRNWQGEGLGRTGHAYIVAADGTLRSDVRAEIENSERFLEDIARAGASRDAVARMRRNGTAILNLALPAAVTAQLRETAQGTHTGTDFRDVPIVRSHTRLNLPGLEWFLVAEMEVAEAFEPVSGLVRQLLVVGVAVTFVFLGAAWWLGRSISQPMQALVAGTRALAARDFGVRLPVTSGDEVGQLGTAFNDMAERLERTTVSRDELDRANQQLNAQRAELRALAARLITTQEDERSRLARELHDDLTQRLAAASISLGTLARGPADAADYQQRLERVRSDLAQVATDVHGLSRRLHPATLDDLGLVAAVEGECRAFFERGGPPVTFDSQGDLGELSSDVQLALYRIVQEALRNVLTHAAADSVRIRLQGEQSEIIMTIDDDGRGYDRSASDWHPGLGLASMTERARLLGGRVEIHSTPGRGTHITVRLPRRTIA